MESTLCLLHPSAQIPSHNGKSFTSKHTRFVETRGALIQYLPAYLPDLNPIKKVFSVYKAALSQYKDLISGEDDSYDVIDGFITLVFTGYMTQ